MAEGTNTALDAKAIMAEKAENRKNTSAPSSGCEFITASTQLAMSATSSLKAGEKMKKPINAAPTTNATQNQGERISFFFVFAN